MVRVFVQDIKFLYNNGVIIVNIQTLFTQKHLQICKHYLLDICINMKEPLGKRV